MAPLRLAALRLLFCYRPVHAVFWEVLAMTGRRRMLGSALSLVTIGTLAGCLAVARPHQATGQTASGVQASDRKSGFGRPETITGTVSVVKPAEGLLIVTERGPGLPPTTVISGATTVTQNPDGTTTRADSDVSAHPGPGETEYRFRITSSTRLRVNGQSESMRALSGIQDKQATVRFVPERNGNFAKSIEIGP